MPADLYAVLRVSRTATPERIRKAYRKLALKLHPDRGGDAAAFQAATEAHDVLSDPERRARYDATGETAEPPREHAAHAELMSVLSPCLMQVLAECPDATRTHVVSRMRDALQVALRNLEGERKKVASLKARLEASAGRFTRHDAEENLLAAAARAHLAHVEAELKRADGHKGRLERALDHLRTCGYTVDPLPTGMATAGGATYTSGVFSTRGPTW